MRSFTELIDVFFGNYSEDYCRRKGLFLAYDSTGELVAQTRQIVNYNQELVKLDAGYILGGWEEIVIADRPELKDVLLDILRDNNWQQVRLKTIIQGLVLGTTAIKIGKDEDGKIRIGTVPLSGALITKLDDGWDIEWVTYVNNKAIKYREIFTDKAYARFKDGKVETSIPNQYGVPLMFMVANRTSVNPDLEDWQGEAEWETILEQVDEINSIHSRISRIEDRYANPHIIVTGASSAELKKDANVWYNPNKEGHISILEYQGNVIDSMLRRIELLEVIVKNKMPELMLQDISATASGYALKLKLQTLKKKIDGLKDTYFRIFEKIFELIILMETGQHVDVSYKTEEAIPEDTDSILNEMITLNGIGVVSLRTIADSLGYDYDEERQMIADEYRDTSA